MDLQELKFFRAVAAEGSLSKAAQKLNCAQSNLSTKISQLEKELHTELFHRCSHGVTLTPKGEQLLQYAEKLLNLAAETEAVLKDDGTAKGSLTLGSMESTAMTLLPPLLSRYHAENSQVALRIQTGTTAASLQGVLDHTLDGAFAAGPLRHPGLGTKLVQTERLVLVTPKGSSRTPAEALLRQPLLVFPQGCSYRKTLEACLSSRELLPEKIIEFTSLGAILASVSAGLGISLFPEAVVSAFAAAGTLDLQPLPEPFDTLPTLFIYRKDGFMEQSLRQLLALL